MQRYLTHKYTNASLENIIVKRRRPYSTKFEYDRVWSIFVGFFDWTDVMK